MTTAKFDQAVLDFDENYVIVSEYDIYAQLNIDIEFIELYRTDREKAIELLNQIAKEFDRREDFEV